MKWICGFAALVLAAPNAFSQDSVADRFVQKGKQAAAAVLCLDEGVSDRQFRQIVDYFDRQTGEMLAMLHAEPSLWSNVKDKLPIILAPGFDLQDKSDEYKQGFLSAYAISMVMHLRADKSSGKSTESGMSEHEKILCSTIASET